MYNILIYFLLFAIYSIGGWAVETAFVSIQNKKFVDRGFLIGPYCPIYGFGGLAITLFLKNHISYPIIIFLMAVIMCGLIEYFTSYLMEKIFKARWWDYSHRKYNINGRVCLETLIPFGLLGCFVTYISNPFLLKNLNLLSQTNLIIISSIVGFIFLIDIIISFNVISAVKSTVSNINKGAIKDNTEEISKKVKEILKSKSLLGKRLMEAYPDLQAIIKKKKDEIIKKAKEVKDGVNDKVENVKEKITKSAGEIKDTIGEKVQDIHDEIRKKKS